MHEHTTKLEDLPADAADIDVDEHGSWAAACPVASGLCVVSAARRFLIPRSFHSPMIRWTAGGDVLVVDSSTTRGQASGFVFDTSGTEKTRLFLGRSPRCVVVAGERIVVGYGDESIFDGFPPENDGVCVFTSDGGVDFGYRSAVRGAVDIADCYNLAAMGPNQVCFMAYFGAFRLVILDLATRRHEVHPLPGTLAGCSGIVAGERGFYFHAPYHATRSIFRWGPTGTPVQVGKLSGRARAHGRGALLAPGVDGFTIVELERE